MDFVPSWGGRGFSVLFKMRGVRKGCSRERGKDMAEMQFGF